MLKDIRIAIIGCGNLGTSIANGLLEQADFLPQNLHVTKRNPANLLYLQDKGVRVHSDNLIAAKESDIVILGVKPYNVSAILKEIKAGT
jgi:pyrroline-5-carboxylate reductase